MKREAEQAGKDSLSARYEAMTTARSQYLDVARRVSALTIPSLVPPSLAHAHTAQSLQSPYQSVGARGVNNLAAKFLLTLFPPGGQFFKLSVDTLLAKSLEQQKDDDADPLGDLEEALGTVERSIAQRFESAGSRGTLFQTIKHLIVAGNGVLQQLDSGKYKFHPLWRYVCSRDLEGNLLTLIVQEIVTYDSLPMELQALIADPDEQEGENAQTPDKDVEVYTLYELEGGKWNTRQEVGDQKVPGSEASYPEGKEPIICLRFITVDGEDYGRGYAEEYLGDLSTLETLTAAVTDFAAIASKVLFMVNESGLTSKKKLQDAPSGSIVDGNAQDVTVLMLDKAQDFGVARQVGEDAKSRLEQAFLLASSVQRNAERVTAEEIRIMANELEQALGGLYSVLAQELQLPLVRLLMARMQRQGKLPALPKESVSPTIITGLEGLGRATDLQRLDTLMQGVVEAVGQQAIAQYINVGALIKRRATALGVDATGIVKSDQQVQQEMQQQQQAEMAQKVAPIGAQGAVDAMNQQTQPNGGAQ